MSEEQKVGDYFVLNAKSSFFVRIQTEHGSVIDVHPAMKQIISSQMSAYDCCLVSIDGNVHMAHFMCKNGTPFDFYEPRHPDFLGETRQVIPSKVVENFFMRGRSLLESKLRSLKDLLKNLPIYLVAPPPPIPSDEHIHEHSEIFNFSIQQLENPHFRLKIFYTYTRYLESLCREIGIFFLPPNQEGMDLEGFLRQEYWKGATHAETGYYSFLTSL